MVKYGGIGSFRGPIGGHVKYSGNSCLMEALATLLSISGRNLLAAHREKGGRGPSHVESPHPAMSQSARKRRISVRGVPVAAAHTMLLLGGVK